MNQVYNRTQSVSVFAQRPHIILHTERRPFDMQLDYEKKAKDLFNKLELKQKIKGDFSQFVGFLCGVEHTYICLPKIFRYAFTQPGQTNDLGQSFGVDDERAQKYLELARLLRQVFSTFQADKENTHAVNMLEAYLPDQNHPDLNEPISHLMLAEHILKDYQRSGLWVDSEQVLIQSNTGKVNWKRTIQKGGELWVKSNKRKKPIYTAPLVNRRFTYSQHPITLAQIAVLHEIDLLYRPLLMDYALPLPAKTPEIQTSNHQVLSKKLKRSLSMVFQARPRRLANLLIKYLQISEYKGKQDQIDLLGTTSFHVIFERMCLKCLSAHQPQLNLAADKVVWDVSILPEKIRKTKETREGKPQQIDLISQVQEESYSPNSETKETSTDQSKLIHYHLPKDGSDDLLILDAKYYDFIGAIAHSDHTGHLPKLDDIRKQYAYQAWLTATLPHKKIIGNAFLFPTYGVEADLESTTLSTDGQTIPFQRLGKVSLQGKSVMGSVKDAPKSLRQALYLLGIPLDQLMQSYVQNKPYHSVFLGEEIPMLKDGSKDKAEDNSKDTVTR